MKRSISVLLLALIVSFANLADTSFIAYANKLQDLKNQKSNITNERGSIESDLDKASDEINRLQGEQDKVRAEIERFDKAITDTTEKLREKSREIADTKVEIQQLQAEIVELEERIAKRNELLKDRARNFQETGGVVSYLDVLMGAKSFSDFIDRVSAIATIMEADQDILRKHAEDKELLELKQKEVEDKLAKLEEMRADLEALKTSLKSQKAEQRKLLANLKVQEDKVHEHVLDLQEQEELLAAQEIAIQTAIELERARLAELERKRAEEERRRQEAAKNNNNNNTSNSTVDVTPPASSGDFMVPAVGHFTSGYGHRWGRFHYGIDIANRASVPIVAAADGVVIKAYYSPSYGNAVFIAHSINGQVFTTVYAHLRSIHVGSGAVVSKGQTIGIMGNTGDSTGQHLHFELHKGPWTNSKSNAVNPLNYINLR